MIEEREIIFIFICVLPHMSIPHQQEGTNLFSTFEFVPLVPLKVLKSRNLGKNCVVLGLVIFVSSFFFC